MIYGKVDNGKPGNIIKTRNICKGIQFDDVLWIELSLQSTLKLFKSLRNWTWEVTLVLKCLISPLREQDLFIIWREYCLLLCMTSRGPLWILCVNQGEAFIVFMAIIVDWTFWTREKVSFNFKEVIWEKRKYKYRNQNVTNRKFVDYKVEILSKILVWIFMLNLIILDLELSKLLYIYMV